MPRLLKICGLALALSLATTTARAIDDRHRQALEAEPGRIAAADGLAARNGDRLTLRLANGGTAVRQNLHECGGNGLPFNEARCVRYVFVDQMAQHRAFLVLVLTYEGYAYEWIDGRTGKATVIEDEPHVSPSGDRFVVVKASELGFNGIQVWTWKAGTIVLEWQRELADFYAFRQWTADGVELAVSKIIGNELVENLPATLIKTSTTWELREPPAPPR